MNVIRFTNKKINVPKFTQLLNQLSSERSRKYNPLIGKKPATEINKPSTIRSLVIKHMKKPQIKTISYFSQIVKIILLAMQNKHNCSNELYSKIIIDNMVTNKSSHYVSILKDRMINDFPEEFLKRQYSYCESVIRLPKISMYYKNYLTFFCIPTFTDNSINMKIHSHSDYKAELYYKQHHGENKKCLDEGKKKIEDSINKHTNDYNRTLFTSEIKKKIEVSNDDSKSVITSLKKHFHFNLPPNTPVSTVEKTINNNSLALNVDNKSLACMNGELVTDRSRENSIRDILLSFEREDTVEHCLDTQAQAQVQTVRDIRKNTDTMDTNRRIQTEYKNQYKNSVAKKAKMQSKTKISFPKGNQFNGMKFPVSVVDKFAIQSRNRPSYQNGTMTKNNLLPETLISVRTETYCNNNTPKYSKTMSYNAGKVGVKKKIISQSRNLTSRLPVTLSLKKYPTLSSDKFSQSKNSRLIFDKKQVHQTDVHLFSPQLIPKKLIQGSTKTKPSILKKSMGQQQKENRGQIGSGVGKKVVHAG